MQGRDEMTYADMIAKNDTAALYEIQYSDGASTGCGTQAEIVGLVNDGIFGVPSSELRFVKIA